MTAEGQARNGFPEFRVYIFGVDVTNDVTNVSVTLQDDARSPSTARITLTNSDDRYVVTEEDIFALYQNDGVKPEDVTLPAFEPGVGTVDQRDFALSQYRGRSLEKQTAALLKRFPRMKRKEAEALAAKALTYADDRLNTVLAAYDKLVGYAQSAAQGFRDQIKASVLATKIDKFQKISQPGVAELGNTSTRDIRRIRALIGDAPRYNLFAGHPIFHSNDPVRVFWKDPFPPHDWYYGFTGFISNWSTSYVAQHGLRAVSFDCEDVTRILRYSRVATNPGIFDTEAISESEDYIFRTFHRDDFYKLSISEVMFLILFGPTLPGLAEVLRDNGNLSPRDYAAVKNATEVNYARHSVNGSSHQGVPRYGTGAFSSERSRIFVLELGEDVSEDQAPSKSDAVQNAEVRLRGPNALAAYQTLIDHRVSKDDLRALALPGENPIAVKDDPVLKYTRIEDVVDAIGRNPHIYPVDAGAFYMLTPSGLAPGMNRSLLEIGFRGPELQTSFKTRLGMIQTLLERIEFRFYSTPRGDVLAEMPLYDFEPRDFGERALTLRELLAAQGEDAFLLPGGSSGREIDRSSAAGFAAQYTLAANALGDGSQSFRDESIRTQMRTTPLNIQNLPETGRAEDIGFQPQVTTLRSLVPQFGLRLEKVDTPGFVSSNEAAKLYCELKLNLWNAEAITSQEDTVFRLGLGLNRPVEVLDVPYVATIRTITRSIDWNARSVSQTNGLNYTRVWDGSLDDQKRKVYMPLGGSASRPLNYRRLFLRKDEKQPSNKPRPKNKVIR